MSFKKLPSSGNQRGDDGLLLGCLKSSEHDTSSDEVHQIEDYVKCKQERTTSHSQNLLYVSSLLMEH
jgi:hypothetical protein